MGAPRPASRKDSEVTPRAWPVAKGGRERNDGHQLRWFQSPRMGPRGERCGSGGRGRHRLSVTGAVACDPLPPVSSATVGQCATPRLGPGQAWHPAGPVTQALSYPGTARLPPSGDIWGRQAEAEQGRKEAEWCPFSESNSPQSVPTPPGAVGVKRGDELTAEGRSRGPGCGGGEAPCPDVVPSLNPSP